VENILVIRNFKRKQVIAYKFMELIKEVNKNMINKQKLDKIRANINNYFSELEGNEKFSGAILVSINGEKVINQGYGMLNYELDVPNTPKTKFRIGSVTKQFTAVAIMQLYENGLLNLYDTLDKYISDYPKGNKVTIHHLLTHTSGIFNHTSIEGFDKNIMRNNHSVEDLIEEFKNLPFDFEPGTKYSYSNSGFILLGYLIEKISKKSYKQYLQENIFNKLLMNDTGYDDHIQLIKNRASGYSLEGEEKILSNCDFVDMHVPYAAGALYSTVEDLHIWNKGLFQGKVISEESFNKMISKHANAGEKGYYGYGIFIRDVELGGQVRKKVYHGGGIDGFLSANNIFINEDVQIIMITNILNEYFGVRVAKVESIVFEDM
jgi:CubicO group peptidase (beta-lactamase class C family)